MSPRNRDDFSAAIVLALAKRASYICSNPGCHNLTIGPASNDVEKIVFLGKAAHITAASPGGARYDPSLTTEQRRDITNGIFLCPGCADKVDKNKGLDHSVELLRKWKRDHEKWVKKNLNKSIHSLVDLRAPALHVMFDDGLTTHEIEKGRVGAEYVEQKGELGNRIVRVDLRLTNTGSGPANDIDLILGFDPKLHVCSRERCGECGTSIHSIQSIPRKPISLKSFAGRIGLPKKKWLLSSSMNLALASSKVSWLRADKRLP